MSSRVPFNFLEKCIALKKQVKQSLGKNIHLDDKKKKRIYDWYSCILYNIYKESKTLLHGKQLFTEDPQSQWLDQFINILKYKIENLKDLEDPTIQGSESVFAPPASARQLSNYSNSGYFETGTRKLVKTYKICYLVIFFNNITFNYIFLRKKEMFDFLRRKNNVKFKCR